MFQRGGSVVCRSAGSGSCAAEFQQLPLSVTVALNSLVSIERYARLASVSKSIKKKKSRLVLTMTESKKYSDGNTSAF